MGMTALGVLVAMAGSAGAVSDRNTSERGQMIPSPDTPAGMGHVNNMMQERMAAAGGPTDRTVTAFGEEIVKTLPLIPGASVITYPVITPSGNLFAGHGRGIGFSSITVHEPVTGRIIWQTPRYLGPQDYLLQRTVGPGAYLGGYPGIVDDGTLATNNYATTSDAHNIWAFDADSGEVKWVTSQSDWAPGPQRVREEPLRPQSMANDTTIATPLLPKALKAPSGEPLAGSLFTRGNFAYVDMLNGDLVILQNGDADNLAVGYQAPILYLIIDLLCFPGGQVSLEFKDFCSAFVYTRYFSVNTVMADPIRNRVTVTYAGDGATFDRFMTWEFITDGGPGQPGTILPDADLTDGDSPAMQLSWSTNFGLNSGATPTWSDSGTVIFGVDGAGITNAFDANTGEVLASSTGGGAGFSPSTDHNDLLVICSPEAGLAQVSPIDGSFIFQNTADGLGLEHLPVMPDSPLLVTGRPGEQCVGFPVTHPDMYQAQFVLGYPIRLLEALAALGIPIPSTVTSTAIADFQADAQTGETIPAKFRSVYNGSGEASLGAMDSGRYISGRVDAVAAINAGILNLLLPRRFDVPPAEGGFLISEPRSWRESVLAQFQGAAQYCDEVINGRFGPNGGVITEPLPVVVAAPDAFNKARWLQLNVNKVGYINSIMKNSVPGRLNNANAAGEIGDLEAAVVVGNAADIVVAITVARGILLANQPADPSRAQQNQAIAAIVAACGIVDRTINILDRVLCSDDAQCNDGSACTVDSCATSIGACISEPADAGTPCQGNGSCDGNGICVPPTDVCDGCPPTLNACTVNECNESTQQCEVSNVPDGTVCAPNGACVSGECVVDLCAGKDCDDGNECTSNLCDPATGDCSNPPAADGTVCNGGAGSCQGGACVDDPCAGQNCDDGDECTDNACDPATGLCINDPLPEGTPCAEFPNGYCAIGGDCVSGMVDADNAVVCRIGALAISLELLTSTTISEAPNPGATLVMTNRVQGVNVPLSALGLDPSVQQGVVLLFADFEISVVGGVPTRIVISDPNTPRAITDGFNIDTGDVMTDVTVDVGPSFLGTQLSNGQAAASALGGLVIVQIGPDGELCNIEGGGAVFPIVNAEPECEKDRNCDDDNECTEDICDAGSCSNTPKGGSSCGGLVFGGKGVCSDAGVCEPPTTCNGLLGGDRDCEDGNECTKDECQDDVCVYTPKTGDRCGNVLEDDKFCSAEGVCEDATGPVECQNDRDCKDSNDCTDDVCNAGTCFNPILSGEECGFIGSKGICDEAGECVPPPDTGCQRNRDCDDNLECTTDRCDAETGECSNTANEGNACGGLIFPGGGTCDADGVCNENPECEVNSDCNDDDECTLDVCDTGTGECTNAVSEGADCSTGTCDASGVCVCSRNSDCDDDIECTDDVCDAGQCSNAVDEGGSCGGLILGGKGVCDADAVCQPPTDCGGIGGDLDCEDGNECTRDRCENNQCVYTPDEGSRCGGPFDDNRCSAEGVCETPDGGTGCQNDLNCDDGNECTTGRCDGNVCVFIVDEGNSCGPSGSGNVCDADGMCVESPPVGGDECNRDRDCKDDNSCTQDICENGICSNPADDGAACGGLVGVGLCNVDGECVEQRRCAVDLSCDDGNDCTTDNCRLLSLGGLGVCRYPLEDAGTQCGPGLTGGDGVCDSGGQCVLQCGGITPDEDCNYAIGSEQRACISGMCESDGLCSFVVNTGADCSGFFGAPATCSSGGACIEEGRCFADLDCQDDNDCTFDQCDIFAVRPGEVATCEFPAKPEGTRCGALGTGTCNGSGTCIDN